MNSAIANKNRANAVIAKVKRLLVRRSGDSGIRALSRSLGIAVDLGGDKTVTKDFFVGALREQEIELSQDDVSSLWAVYDRKGNGLVDPVDIIAALRCGLNALRRTYVQRAWGSFSKDPNGNARIHELQSSFHADGHPEVIRGNRTAKEVHADFMNAFNEKTNPDGTLTPQEFEQYYSAVSAAVEEDESFAALIRGTWKLPGVEPYFTRTLALTATTKDRSFYALQTLDVKLTVTSRMQQQVALTKVIAEHRNALLHAKIGFRGVGRLLRSKDIANTAYLTQEDFLDALWQNRLYIEDKSLLAELDTNNDNTIDTALYMNMLLGELPPARKVAMERLWSRFATDRQHSADISEVHKRYKAKDGHALNSFLEAWDKRAVRSGRVFMNELIEWYTPLSDATQMDAVFEQIILSEWS